MTKLEDQVNLIRDVLEFNKNVVTLKRPPTLEIETIREKCAQIKVFDFNVNVSDVELIKKIAEFADTYKGWENEKT